MRAQSHWCGASMIPEYITMRHSDFQKFDLMPFEINWLLTISIYASEEFPFIEGKVVGKEGKNLS